MRRQFVAEPNRPCRITTEGPDPVTEKESADDTKIVYRRQFLRGRYRSVIVPSKASAARATVSERVGWGCTVRPIS